MGIFFANGYIFVNIPKKKPMGGCLKRGVPKCSDFCFNKRGVFSVNLMVMNIMAPMF